MRHRLRFCLRKLTYSVALKEWIASMLKEKHKENCKVTRHLNWKVKKLLDVSGLVLQDLSCHSLPFGKAVSVVAGNRVWSRPYVLMSVWKSVHFSDLSQPVVFKTPADTWHFLLKKSDLRIKVSNNILYIKVLIFVVYPPSVRVIPYLPLLTFKISSFPHSMLEWFCKGNGQICWWNQVYLVCKLSVCCKITSY